MPKSEQSSSRRPKLPAMSPMYNKDNTDMVSYEDLLIAQYLEELRKAKSQMKKTKDVPASPYTQKLPHSDYGYHSFSKRRPMSASSSSSKPKIDPKFIADPNIWDPATPRSSVTDKRFGRPISAPVRKRRPISGSSTLSWNLSRRGYNIFGRPSSAFSARRIRSQYKRQPKMIRVTAFKNGTRESFVRLAAPTVKIFLEMCTDKLQLPFAARRIFLEDGVEVFDARDIPIDGEVYVSTGENYKDPYVKIKKNIMISQDAKWTLSGILLPEEAHVRTKQAKMTKRMKELTAKRRVRIVVYRNGMSTEPIEVVADLEKMEEFLVACTHKLDLRCHARTVFDWEGREIQHLTDTPILDDCMQPGGTAILGPVWVSAGESFSAIATLHYMNGIKQALNDRLKDAKKYHKEITNAMEGNKEDITVTAILSMSEEELYSTCDLAEKEIEQLKTALKELKEKIRNIEELKAQEESEGSNYRMNHIQELPVDHRLVGRKGIRLKVFENGQSTGDQPFYFNIAAALKGTASNDAKDKAKRLQRLLDDLSATRVTSNTMNPKLTPIAKKIFDRYGNEIKDIFHLENDQEIWVSFGENFISPFTYCLQAIFDKVTPYSVDGQQCLLRNQLMADELKEILKECNKGDAADYNAFEATAGFPSEVELKIPVKEEEGNVKDSAALSGLNPNGHFIMSKNHSTSMYPEVVVHTKMKRGEANMWPSDAQIWVISKRGYIYMKGMPQLCLAVSDARVEFRIGSPESPSTGYVVTLQKVTSGNVYQQWTFNPDASISSVAHPDLYLTYTGHQFGNEDSYVQPDGVYPGQRIYLVITDRLPSKIFSYQRFALKQERLDNLGQWKYNDATNKEWNKLAYSWPVKENGTLNEEYDWPMEGFLLPNAPPLHKSSPKNALSGMTPARLLCLKNGERDLRKAIVIVGPNLTNFIKDTGKEKDKNKKNKKTEPTDNNTAAEEAGHGKEDLELKMFLDQCTSQLSLPFAARRLFDAHGNEHFSLARLKRDELVYVSCGEAWTDPKLSRAEQQRRFLLSQLSQDVAKIRQYCALRNPENYVLEVEEKLSADSRVVVNRQWKQGQDEEEEERTEAVYDAQSHHSQTKSDVKSSFDFEGLTSHERAHEKAEQRLNNLKWPWERLVNVSNSSDLSDAEAQKYTDKELYEKYKPAVTPRVSRDTLQRFVYEDNYIACVANRNLVLGVLEQDGRVSQVMLTKRQPDNIHQRWLLKENGEIRSKYNQRMVLTVAMPANEPFAEDEQGRPLTFSGCAVTLAQRKNNQYGKAHQRWTYDAETGFIRAFETNQYDKEITAANKADVCTFSIAADTKIDQPGYQVEVPTTAPTDRQHIRRILVCTSCARAMRGRYKLTKLVDQTEFKCAMGEAKKLNLMQIGSFRVLNGKVDLSKYEAELTLEKWEDTLANLREETSVRTIAKELSVAKTVRTVKIIAYKNGEGRLRQGELICGSSIEGILAQCTRRLGLTNAAQKIFTEDGTLVLEVEDLVDWAVNSYKSLMVRQIERIMSGKNKEPEFEAREDEDEQQEETESPAMMEQKDEEEEEDDELGGDSLMRKIAEKKRQRMMTHVDERGEGEGQDSPKATDVDVNESAEFDQQESAKIAKDHEKLLEGVPIPPLEVILRYPIEVWVSSGKDFVPPEKVESKMESRRKKRAFRAAVSLELDMEKHILRQMKGRRYEDMSPGKYKSTRNSRQPVVIEGNWEEPTVEEQMKHDTVHKLETHLAEVKANQKEKKAALNINLKGKLYQQPDMKRIQVYPNGESLERATYVWGDSIEQLLMGATLRLGLWAQAKHLYNMEGRKITDFKEIDRDELLCVSTGKPFIRPHSNREVVEIKANWSRARKQYGPNATDYVVEAKGNATVDVDPFGPPELAIKSS